MEPLLINPATPNPHSSNLIKILILNSSKIKTLINLTIKKTNPSIKNSILKNGLSIKTIKDNPITEIIKDLLTIGIESLLIEMKKNHLTEMIENLLIETTDNHSKEKIKNPLTKVKEDLSIGIKENLMTEMIENLSIGTKENLSIGMIEMIENLTDLRKFLRRSLTNKHRIETLSMKKNNLSK